MNFIINDITNDDEWDKLILQFPRYSFLNSSARIKYNSEVYRDSGKFCVKSDGKVVALCNWFISNSRFPFLYTQHSPTFGNSEDMDDLITIIVSRLKSIALRNHCVYVELGPLNEGILFIKNGILAPIANIDALVTLHINVEKDIQQLRMEMSASCKNAVNKLSKDPRIEVKVFNDNSQVDLFLKLIKETQKDKGFNGKSDDKFRKELEYYAINKMLYFIVGYLDGEPIGMRVNVKFGKILTDYQACISSQARIHNIRIAYLLCYKTMLLARDLGCSTWDMFGGMSVENAKEHPWKGIEEFKRSFGGKKVTYSHPIDIPLNVIYVLSYAYRYFMTRKHKFTTNW